MASGLAARNGGWIGLGALVAIFLLGLGLRVGEAWDGRAPVYDAQAYAAIARNLDEGHGFTVGAGALGGGPGSGGGGGATHPWSTPPGGLPLFGAGLCEAAGGAHERLAGVVRGVVGALSILFASFMGRGLTPLRPRPPHRPGSC